MLENAQEAFAAAKSSGREQSVLNLLRQKLDKLSDEQVADLEGSGKGKAKEAEIAESAKWVAANEFVEWKDIEILNDEPSASSPLRERKRSRTNDAQEIEDSYASASEPAAASMPTKVLYTCGVELYQEDFGSNWKIFSELTAPRYSPHTPSAASSPKTYSTVQDDVAIIVAPPPGTEENLYQKY